MYRFKLILEIMCKENLFSNVQEMGYHILNSLKELSNEFPGYLTNVRGAGLFCAFDLPSTLERNKLIEKALNNKMFILGSGDNSIRFRPHLNVTSEDLKTSIDIIKSTIKATLN